MADETPQRRVIGRILSLGFPLPGVRVDNYSFLSAPSFFDYDAMVVDPSALVKLVAGVIDGSVEANTFSGRRVTTAASAPDEASLADVLLRRRDETRALLDHGGVVICFAHPAEPLRGVDGAADIDSYFWLGDLAPDTVPADGTQAQISDYQHPMASFVHSQLANVAYRAQLPTAENVFARSYGGAAIGGEIASDRMPSGGGRIVLLPALKSLPSGDARYAMSEALQAGIRRMLGIAAEGRAPHWVPAFDVPGLTERTRDADLGRAAASAALESASTAERATDELAKYRRLLWQRGQVGLEDVVLDALKLIGFSVYGNNPETLEIRDATTRVLLEIEAGDGAIDLAPHHRLRERIERAIEKSGEAPRGLIIINGHRLLPPAERPAQASDALRTAAETMRYAIAPTTGLFAAVVAALSDHTDGTAEYRARLIAHDGVVAD